MSQDDTRPIEVRVEAAFDRFNRAVIMGMEPSPLLFMEALEAEGLRVSLTVPETLESTSSPAPGTKMPVRADSVTAGRRADDLILRRTRAQY
ncbi:MAG: hypothetical protein ABJA81_12770 [Nocardioidaceae bacterium]